MNKYSLRFHNASLEKKYKEQSILQVKQFFQFTQVVFILISIAFILDALIQTKRLRTIIQYSSFILVLGISYYIGAYKKPHWIPTILFLQNFVIGFFQLYYVPSIYQWSGGGSNTVFTTPASSFVMGLVVSTVHFALTVGPDFVENCIYISILFTFKTILAIYINFAAIDVVLPLFIIYLVLALYSKQSISRKNYMWSELNKQ